MNPIVPIMTSNTTPSGEAFANSQGTGRNAYFAFDGNTSTWWATNAVKTNSYVGYTPANKARVKKVSFHHNGRDIGKFRVEALDDAGTWISLYNGEITSSDPWDVTYDINNTEYYKSYRLYVLGVMSGGASSSSISVFELQFYGSIKH